VWVCVCVRARVGVCVCVRVCVHVQYCTGKLKDAVRAEAGPASTGNRISLSYGCEDVVARHMARLRAQSVVVRYTVCFET
jgi:hypothetical protein